MAEEVGALRRWRLLDAILLIAATAAAMLPAKDRWPEVMPVARKLEATRLLDDTYWKGCFAGKCGLGQDGFGSSPVRADRRAGAGAGEIHRDWHNAADCDIARPGNLGVGPCFAQCAWGLRRARRVLPRLSVLVPLVGLLPRATADPASAGVVRPVSSARLVGVLQLGFGERHGDSGGIVARAPRAVGRRPGDSGGGVDRPRRMRESTGRAVRGLTAQGRVLGVLWFGMIPVYLVGFVFSKV